MPFQNIQRYMILSDLIIPELYGMGEEYNAVHFLVANPCEVPS